MIPDEDKYVSMDTVKEILRQVELDRDRYVIFLPYAVKIPKWIPVTEGLPGKEMLCLVSRNCTRPILLEQVEIDVWYIPKVQSLGYWLKSSSWNVTAWMPLLKPYKEVNEDE